MFSEPAAQLLGADSKTPLIWGVTDWKHSEISSLNYEVQKNLIFAQARSLSVRWQFRKRLLKGITVNGD